MKTIKIKYFDYNATTPIASAVWESMQPFFTEHFGNPSSTHQLGNIPKNAIKKARRQVASLLGAVDEQDIIFTSGGTESNNAAFRSALAAKPDRKEIITSAVEHSSVLKVCKQLENEGYKVHRIGVDENGKINLSELFKVLSDRTALVSLMMANNETGVLFPFQEIGELLKSREILFHIDAVQVVGKLNFSVKNFPVDYLSIAGHKFYGPKGIGALYVRSGVPYQSLIFGGSQERGRRAGTENVPGIVGLGAAAQFVQEKIQSEITRLEALRNDFETKISQQLSGITINGKLAERLCNTSNIAFDEIESETLLMVLDQKRICVSSGSACMSGAQDPSHVLKTMGLSDIKAKSSMRFSFGYTTTEEEVEDLIAEVIKAVEELRALKSKTRQDKQEVMA